MNKVYGLMSVGMVLTGAVAWGVGTSDVLMQVLRNQPGPARDIVAFNAGVALYAANVADSIQDGVQRAQAVLVSGAALAKLEALVALSHALGGQA
jgi:anthranilate phosphoribosyltransferase